MNRLPTFIRAAFDRYRSLRELPDAYFKYKALESVYAATIKYIGTTFALIAADRDSELQSVTWGKIFDSSSLGGWLDAAEYVCKRAPDFSEKTKAHCSEYSDYKKHPHKDQLEKIAGHLNCIVKELENTGYKMEHLRSPNLIRALRYSVRIRNKCAHGAFNSLFFSRIEKDYHSALKMILHLAPFSSFVFWGRYGSHALELVEWPPRYRRRTLDARFWAKSHLLSKGFATSIPFMEYREDSQCTYFLNESVNPDAADSEFIDYHHGNVTYRTVDREWPAAAGPRPRTLRPQNYKQHIGVLSGKLAWREVPLTRSGIDATAGETGVYVFTTRVELGGKPVDVVLYVGKTTDLTRRLRSYVQIRKGYSSGRREIAYMFTTYGDAVKMLFAALGGSQIANVERAIYETTMPEFNRVAPPAVDV